MKFQEVSLAIGGSGARPGKELERLVAALETVLAGSGAAIESPSRRLVDRDTGRRREFDVLITWDHGHHKVIAAIECKDRSRPISVTDVEGFIHKCDRTGVNARIMVSSTGFAKTARKKAEASSVTCMDLEEVAEFDWIPMTQMVGYMRQFDHVVVKVMFNDQAPASVAALFDKSGTELTEEQVSAALTRAVPDAENPDVEVGRTIPVRMIVKTDGWTAKDRAGQRWNVDHLLVITAFETLRVERDVVKHRYVGGGKEYAFASAESPFDKHAGKFLFVLQDDGSTGIFFAPQDDAKK